MNKYTSIIWISLAGIIGVLFGIFYSLFGLDSLPVYKKFVPNTVYTAWSNGLYGSTFIGFSVLIFFVGRHAFQTGNKTLLKALLYGIMSWLIVEAFFSLYYGIYINVLVDIALTIFLGLPLVLGIRAKK
ncbi:MAG: hypothetical protein UR15_C0025G0014 [Parcubacteria group bacterium GW2011_GWA2_31_28]|nr:MAG: hypothetical protein UR15_C0025G0014 [Parcubacteria group bacterium GW2011_GWA2_31_28]